MALQTRVCKHCKESFEAHDTARTAQMGYCSRACMNGDTRREAAAYSRGE